MSKTAGADALKLIGDLADEFPGNPLLRADVLKLRNSVNGIHRDA
jgi:hypothetical protein